MKILEQEIQILMLSNDIDALDYFYRSYSSSISGRRSKDLFEKESDNGFIINLKDENSRVVDMLNAYLNAIGYKIVIKYNDEKKNAPINVKCDIPALPKFIKSQFSA